jgi:hypothetical protein
MQYLVWLQPQRKISLSLVFDISKLACAGIIFFAPWVFLLDVIPTWNLWVCGYAVFALSLTALAAEADWEPLGNLCLGGWLMTAPWILGFESDPTATFIHVIGGGLITILSIGTLLVLRHNPPRRFRPGSALRPGVAPGMNEALLVGSFESERLPVGRHSVARRVRRGSRRSRSATKKFSRPPSAVRPRDASLPLVQRAA